MSHLAPVKRILRYVKGSVGCRILFPTTDTGRKCNFLGFTDPIGVEIKMIESLQLDTYLCWYNTNLMVFEEGTGTCTLIL